MPVAEKRFLRRVVELETLSFDARCDLEPVPRKSRSLVRSLGDVPITTAFTRSE